MKSSISGCPNVTLHNIIHGSYGGLIRSGSSGMRRAKPACRQTYLAMCRCRRLPAAAMDVWAWLRERRAVSPTLRITSPTARPVEAMLPGDTCRRKTNAYLAGGKRIAGRAVVCFTRHTLNTGGGGFAGGLHTAHTLRVRLLLLYYNDGQ